jgi:hypothetical protein
MTQNHDTQINVFDLGEGSEPRAQEIDNGHISYIDHNARTTHWSQPSASLEVREKMHAGVQAHQCSTGRLAIRHQARRTSISLTILHIRTPGLIQDNAPGLPLMKQSAVLHLLNGRTKNPLLHGRVIMASRSNRPCFVDHNMRTTMWNDPRVTAASATDETT